MFRPHPQIPHAWELSADPAFPAPRVGAIGALHGNEIGGLRAIERVRAEAESFAPRLLRGTLVLVHGNPRATEQKRRYTEGGTDLNRLFGYRFVSELAKEAWTYEHHRALELEPLVTDVDALIDLHSATRPTVPFAICDGTARGIALARRTGSRVTYGWDGPGMLMDQVSIGPLVASGRPALSVECGQHDDPATAEHAYLVLTRFLGALGYTDHATSEESGPGYRLFARVVKPTQGFALSGNYRSFDRLPAGSVLGHGEGVTISLDEEAFLLLPTPQATRGEDIVYLARRE
jgi:uncharacterized protein